MARKRPITADGGARPDEIRETAHAVVYTFTGNREFAKARARSAYKDDHGETPEFCRSESAFNRTYVVCGMFAADDEEDTADV